MMHIVCKHSIAIRQARAFRTLPHRNDGQMLHLSVERRRRNLNVVPSLGQDAVDGWLDVASLVSSGGSKAQSAYSDLSYAIGRDVYVDVAGWHLYFRDLSAAPGLKAHDLLANLLGPQIGRSGMSEQDIVILLGKIPIKLGAGKLQVALFDVVPRACVQDLVRITEDFGQSK